MTNQRTKKKYNFLLSLAFIGIGGYKLYQKFYLQEELAAYQWILAAGLVSMGIYQLVVLYLRSKSDQ